MKLFGVVPTNIGKFLVIVTKARKLYLIFTEKPMRDSNNSHDSQFAIFNLPLANEFMSCMEKGKLLIITPQVYNENYEDYIQYYKYYIRYYFLFFSLQVLTNEVWQF